MNESLDTFAIVVGLAGGLALFLFGMDQLSNGLKLVAGVRLKALLARFTKDRIRGSFVGAFVTAVVQSSSITTVLLVGFISAGLMTLAQSVPVIMGANIGTTITAQVVAFDVGGYGLVGVAVGFLMMFAGRSSTMKNLGTALMGLGLVFFGMELMGDATRPLRTFPPFISAMESLESPVTGILVGAAFTALVQSSSATTALVIALASQGALTLEAGIILVLGANIGTCITAILAAIGKKSEARQAAGVHVLFNVVGVVAWIAFVDDLAGIVAQISPTSPELLGTERLAAETPRQIANAHTVFNIVNTVVLIWFVKPMAWIVQKVIQPRDEEDRRVQPRYLDKALIPTPDLALDRVRMELRRVSDRVTEMFEGSLEAVVRGTMEDLENVRSQDQDIDVLYTEVIGYLSKVSAQNLNPAHVDLLGTYIQVANNLESIGDMIEDNMFEIGRKRLESGVTISDGTAQQFEELHAKVAWAVRLACQAFDGGNSRLALEVAEAKREVTLLADTLERRLSTRVGASESHRRALYQLESELIEYLKRVYYFAKRIAKATVSLEEASATAEV